MDSRTSQLSIKGSFGSIQRQMILSFFFSSARATLVTLRQDIYSTVQYSTYLTRTTKHNKLIQFPVCANVGVLFILEILLHASKKHIQTRFSLQQFRFWSITQSEMLCYVSVQCYLRQSYGSDFSMGFIDQVAIFSDFIRLFELLGPGFTPYGSSAFYILE